MPADRTTRKIGGVLDAVAIRLPVGEPELLDPDARALLAAFDGRHKVRDVARTLGIKPGAALRATLDLVDHGLISFTSA
jgi:hypothetical protein